MKKDKEKRFHYGFVIFFACCAICFSSVTLSFNTAGIFYVPASEELGVGTGRFGLYMTVQYAAMGLFMIPGGKVLHRFNARIVLTVCVGMISGSLLAMSAFSQLWQFYIAGFLLGSANSILLYLMVPTMIDRWFKERVGFFIGAAFCFTGIGAIIFNPLGGFVIDTLGWRAGYLVFGLLSLGIGFPAALVLIRDCPANKDLLRFGEKASEGQADGQRSVPGCGGEGVPYRQALRSPALLLVALYAGMMDIGITLNYYLPAYVDSLGHSILVVSSVASMVMVGQLLGKLLLGFVNDINVKYGVLTAVTGGVAGIAVMAFLGNCGLWALYVGALFFGVFFAGATVTTSLMTRGVFGSRDFERIFAVVATVAALSSAFSSAIWGTIVDITGSYYVMLVVGLIMMVPIYVVGHYALNVGEKQRRKYDREQVDNTVVDSASEEYTI